MQKEEWDADAAQAGHERRSGRPVTKGGLRCGRATRTMITPEQYEEFYKQISYDSEAPLGLPRTNRVEGRSEYTQLLYIPGERRPSTCGTATKRGGVKLYVKRVFIMGRRRSR